MASGELRLPVLIGTRVAPAQDALKLLVGPGVEVDRLDAADVGAHSSVDARASNADEDAEVPGGPSRVCQQSELVIERKQRDLRERSLRLFFLQSAHSLLASNFRRLLMVDWFCIVRSTAGFGGLRDMVACLARKGTVDAADGGQLQRRVCRRKTRQYRSLGLRKTGNREGQSCLLHLGRERDMDRSWASETPHPAIKAAEGLV